jgi:hypothetical protein
MQSRETGLHLADSLVTGKEQRISRENVRDAKIGWGFLLPKQVVVEEFPARENRELNHPSRERISQDQGPASRRQGVIGTHAVFVCSPIANRE